MRKASVAIILLLVFVVTFSACYAGPHQLQRTIDDWDAQLYTNSPWLDAVLWIVPVIPLAKFGTAIGDFFVTDAYYFWLKDAWDGKGTGFKHKEILGEDGYLESLLLEGSGWLSVKK